MNRLVQAGCVLLLMAAPCVAGDDSSGKQKRILSARELVELGDKSKAQYSTHKVKSVAELPAFQHPGFPQDGPPGETPYPVITSGDNGSRALTSFAISDTCRKALQDAEPLFQSKEYAKALAIYREASSKEPTCYVLYTMMGDCLLFSGDPQAALASYDKTISRNPDDYHGHWFRASALVELGKMEDARHAYARSLAMSPGNPTIIQAIDVRSGRMGFHASGDLFHPRAMARPEGGGFGIYFVEESHWWVYGLCKAEWLAEEGHRKDLTGTTEHHWTNTEELECLGALLEKYQMDRGQSKVTPEPELDRLWEVLKSGYIDAFINYEFGSQVSREFTILLDPGSQERLREFVEKYVFQKP
jgi:tetratricopeptide (TPR) repeat protein